MKSLDRRGYGKAKEGGQGTQDNTNGAQKEAQYHAGERRGKIREKAEKK